MSHFFCILADWFQGFRKKENEQLEWDEANVAVTIMYLKMSFNI